MLTDVASAHAKHTFDIAVSVMLFFQVRVYELLFSNIYISNTNFLLLGNSYYIGDCNIN